VPALGAIVPPAGVAVPLVRTHPPTPAPEPSGNSLGELSLVRVTGLVDHLGTRSPTGFTPEQIRRAYGIDSIAFGTLAGDGSGQTIAIVDAYDHPGFVNSSDPHFGSSDLAQFDRQFHLPDPPGFLKLNQDGSLTDLPGTDPAGPGNPGGNWEYEEA